MDKTQITIELFNQCKGTCTGCMLTIDERKAVTPLMSKKVFDLVISKLNDYSKSVNKMYRPIMAFGDFPAMDPSDQESFFEVFDRYKMHFGFTLTLVDESKEDQYFSTIDRALSIDDRTLFDITIDPFRLKNNETYRYLMSESVKKMNHYHMAVLLSEAVLSKISPEELSEVLRDVFGQNVQVNLAFTPSLSNLEKKNYGYNVDSAANYYNRFLDTSPALQEHRLREIERYQKSGGDYYNYVTHGFHVKSDTSIYPVVHTIFGDIILDGRNGSHKALGRLLKQDFCEILDVESRQINYMNSYNNLFMDKGDFDCKKCSFYNACRFHGVGLMRKIYKEYENRTGSCYGPVDFAS